MSARWARTSGSSAPKKYRVLSPLWEVPGTSERGQALVELAVFGSLLLFLIGYLISNALQLDYRQQRTMEAFRRGLASAAASPPGVPNTPASTSHLLIQDRHIPDPSDPFAIGGVSPITAQASITRSYELGARIPETKFDLPRWAVQIENATSCPGTAVGWDNTGNPLTCYYTTAGLRNEYDVPQASLERYRFIYGATSVCDEPHCGGGDGACAPGGWVTAENPETGELETVCVDRLKHVVIVDSCAGDPHAPAEIISLDDCIRQAAQIADDAACDAACQRAAASGATNLDCARMCSQPMGVPWYASGAGCGGGPCTAPVLADLFGGLVNPGVQPGAVQTIVERNTLAKRESPGGVSTTSAVDLTETTERTVIRLSGSSAATDTITAQRNESHTTSMSAP